MRAPWDIVHRAALGGVLLLTAGVLLFLATRQHIGYDSAWHVFIAGQDTWAGFWREVNDNAHPPVFYLSLRAAMAVFGKSLLAYRVVSIASIVASAWLIALIVKRLTGNQTLAVLAAAAFGLSFNAVALGLEVRAYALSTALSLAALLFFLEWVQARGDELRPATEWGFALSLAAAVLTNYSAFFFLAAVLAVPVLVATVDRAWRGALLARVAARPGATVLMFGLPIAVAVGAYVVHVVFWAGGRLNHVPQFMFDPSLESAAAFLLRNTLNLTRLLLPAGRGETALAAAGDPLLPSAGELLWMLLLAAVAAAAASRRVRAHLARPSIVVILIFLVMLGFNAFGGWRARYPYGGALRHEFFLVAFAVLTVFLLIDAVGRASAGAFSRRQVRHGVIAAGLAASVISWAGAFRIEAVPLYDAQMTRFRQVVPDADAVLVDQFTFINFFSHHHEWDWRLAGAWQGQPVRQLWRLERDGRELHVCRDRQWALDLSNLATYASLDECLQKSAADRVALFRTQWELQEPSWETSRTAQLVGTLSDEIGLRPETVVSEGAHVYAQFGALPAGAQAGRIALVRATYGASCNAPAGNATGAVQQTCDGRSRCSFAVDVGVLGDPAPGCAKDFTVEWRCDGDGQSRHLALPAEAGFGSIAHLTCRAGAGAEGLTAAADPPADR